MTFITAAASYEARRSMGIDGGLRGWLGRRNNQDCQSSLGRRPTVKHHHQKEAAVKDNTEEYQTDLSYLRRDLRQRHEPRWKAIDWWTLGMVIVSIVAVLLLTSKGLM